MKARKEFVDYGPGHPHGDHCGICRHFEAPQSCAIVAGRIARLFWCNRFERSGVMAKRGWIAKGIKHPGIEKRRAKEHGVSTHEQLETDSHSSNPTLRARGALGLRFEKGGDLHKARADRRYRRKS